MRAPTQSASLRGWRTTLIVCPDTLRALLTPRPASRAVAHILALMLSLAPAIALAQCEGGGLCNPLDAKFSSIPAFIAGALRVLVIVALPIITLFVVIAGFMYVAARGKPEAIKQANKNFVYVLIGALLILGAWVIATLIGGTVTQLVGK